MGKCYLTDRQQDMIRALVTGLMDGSVETTWSISNPSGRIRGIRGLPPEIRQGDWKDVKPSDLDSFAICGFFVDGWRENCILNTSSILDAVEHNFESDEHPPVSQVNFYGGDFRGTIVNAASTLTNVQQSIDTSPNLDEDAKAQLTRLVDELKTALTELPKDLPEEEADEAEVLAHHAQTAIDQLNKEKPNKKLISVSVDGLEAAAKNIGRIAPRVVTTAAAIAMALRPFMA